MHYDVLQTKLKNSVTLLLLVVGLLDCILHIAKSENWHIVGSIISLSFVRILVKLWTIKSN